MAIPANLSQAGDQTFNQLKQENSKESSAKRHVLVVDDEYGPRQSLRMLLKEDYEVHLAENAAEAMNMLQELPIGLVVSDIRMPKVTGVELLAQIKAFSNDIEVIIMTGYGELETAMKAVEHGAYSYIEKPFDTHHMLDCVNSAFNKHQTERDRRVLENLALEASRFETLGRYVSGTMHDMGTPLTVLSSHLELLSIKPDRDDIDERVNVMREQVKFCTDMARGTMDFLRHDKGTSGPMQLHNVVNSSLTLAQPYFRECKVMCETQLAADLPKITGEKMLFRQCILNVINNACQAMQGQEDHRTIYLGTQEEGDDVCLTIEDNGPGIPAESQKQIFEMFFSTKGENGTGLGLGVVRNVMQRNGGSIELINSVRGNGACFLFRFPKAKEMTPLT